MMFNYPPNTVRVLEYLGYKNLIDYVASVNAEGSISIEWLTGSPLQPADIILAELPAARAEVIAQINTEATRRILSVYPLEKQSSANMGLYPQAYRDQMAEDIAAVIQASNDACDLVNAAVDEAGIDAVVPNWPVIGG